MLSKILNKTKPILSAEDKKFIQKNRDFWSSFPSKENGGKILIEKPSTSEIDQVNSVFAVILNQAKSLQLLFSSFLSHNIRPNLLPAC